MEQVSMAVSPEKEQSTSNQDSPLTTIGDVATLSTNEQSLTILEHITVNNGHSAQSHKSIASSSTVHSKEEQYPKCFVHIPICCPFGIANADERMLVVTPEDDFSLYEDAVVSTYLCVFISWFSLFA